jgi:4-diphosphocytidyl-2-C-methyl-D-erythritol kinase
MRALASTAKLNLALHVLGRRPADGYHLLDSLVVRADCRAGNDTIQLQSAEDWSLSVSGANAADIPTDTRNLVLKAALLAGEHYAAIHPQSMHLQKSLPHGAGLGGGSMNAATLLNALSTDGGWPSELLLKLGADLPACMALQQHGWLRMEGVGERITPLAPLVPGGVFAVLTHPGIGLSTPAVYQACVAGDYAAALPANLPEFTDVAALAQWLHEETANSLQPAAMRLMPEIAQQLHALSVQEGCLLARMSGSGSACFGLFANAEAAALAGQQLAQQYPRWWVQACTLG